MPSLKISNQPPMCSPGDVISAALAPLSSDAHSASYVGCARNACRAVSPRSPNCLNQTSVCSGRHTPPGYASSP
ncbi:MAG: hypothetical protein FJY92_10035 [Candidatus Hydrogenedentes bacterium]|nr:hypothetical protein [Candidatus Hydrogenedentota bacterium]